MSHPVQETKNSTKAQPAVAAQPITEDLTQPQSSMSRRGVYLLPNLFTTANLFAGFFVIISAVHDKFEIAAIAIFIAMILDSLDGRIARLTNTQSAFGAEYDSLSDMVAFGVAPAMLAYTWALSALGRVGVAIAFIYVACAALRLARFNTQIGKTDARYFIGLASPAAAGVVAGMVWSVLWTVDDSKIHAEQAMPFALLLLFAALVATAGLLMVSHFKYNSFKKLYLKGRVPFVVILAVVLIFALAASDPARLILLAFLVYAASGPAQYLWRERQRRQQ